MDQLADFSHFVDSESTLPITFLFNIHIIALKCDLMSRCGDIGMRSIRNTTIVLSLYHLYDVFRFYCINPMFSNLFFIYILCQYQCIALETASSTT